MQVLLNIENPKDWEVLRPIIERLGISIQNTAKTAEKKKRKKVTPKDLAYHQAIVAQGGDASYFGDAGNWQREQRKDRDLPFSAPNL